MFQIRSHSTSSCSSCANRRDAASRVAEHLRELMRVEVALVEQALRRLDHRGDDPRPRDDAAHRADRALAGARRDLPELELELRRAGQRVAPLVHRRRAGMRGLAAEGDLVPLDTERSQHDPEREPHRLEHRPLLDVQLEVRGGVLQLRARLERPVELDAVLGSASGSATPVRVAPLPQLVLVVHRARRRRRAEQRAAEARALLVGPVHQPDGRRRLPVLGEPPHHLHPGHHVQAAVEPAAVRDRVDVPADQHRPLRRPAQRPPLVARLVELVLERQAVELAPQPLARRRPGVRPGDPLRAVLVAGQLTQLLQLGDGSRGIERHGAMLTRAAECGKHPRMASIAVDRTTTPRIGAVHGARAGRARRGRIAVFWGLWEGYRWIGETLGITWPFAVNAVNMPHIHDMLNAFTQPLQPGGPTLAPLRVALGALHREGGAARLRARRGDRLRAGRAARALADHAPRPAALHRRLADGADPGGRADGRRRSRHEGRRAVDRGLRDRRLSDLLPGRDEHAARAALARPARPRADALLRGRPPLGALEAPRARLAAVRVHGAEDLGDRVRDRRDHRRDARLDPGRARRRDRQLQPVLLDRARAAVGDEHRLRRCSASPSSARSSWPRSSSSAAPRSTSRERPPGRRDPGPDQAVQGRRDRALRDRPRRPAAASSSR